MSEQPTAHRPNYDAVLLLSFGGPEGPDDVLPFLRNVTKGRNVPDERLAEVAEQYELFGGKSPINDHCRELQAALKAELQDNGHDLPVYWGNRNWHPMLEDTVATMADDGVRNALVFATSAFSSYSGCRQYREDLERARQSVGDQAPRLQKLRLFYNHPGFVEPLADNVRSTLAAASGESAPPRLVFTAHSIPKSMAATSCYQEQLTESARLVLEAAGLGADYPHDLVFQSRSGPPHIPWLEPDVNDHLKALAAGDAPVDDRVGSVAVVPLGFVSDHMEVLFDLDTQAAETAASLGMAMHRVSTVGNDPRFVAMIRKLIEEQLTQAPRLSLGTDGAWPDECPEGHCVPAARPTRPAS